MVIYNRVYKHQPDKWAPFFLGEMPLCRIYNQTKQAFATEAFTQSGIS